MIMSRKLKIRDLAKYYVDRYKLYTPDESDNYAGFDDVLGSYVTQITRIIKSVSIGETNLWKIIKPDHGARQISIEDFESHCFDLWSGYIERNCNNYNKKQLENDKERHISQKDDAYWAKKAEEAIQEHNRLIETKDWNEENSDKPFLGVSEEKFLQKGHNMMLEALYDVFYEPFNWGLLKYDMQCSIVHDTGYNPPITGKTEKSRFQLEDYHNYIGKKKMFFKK